MSSILLNLVIAHGYTADSNEYECGSKYGDYPFKENVTTIFY